MKITNKNLFKIHSWCGLIAGIFILAITLTGAFIALSKEYDRIIHPNLLLVKNQNNKYKYDKVFENAKKHLTNFHLYDYARLPQAKDESIELLYFPDDSYHSAFFNPYNGNYLGNLEYDVSRTIIKFHWSFFVGWFGALIALLVGIAVVLSIITGFIIYKKHLFDALLFQIKLKNNANKISFSGLHRVIGVYSMIFMFVLFATGSYINYHIVNGDYSFPQGETLKQKPKYLLSVSIDKMIQEINLKDQKFIPTGISFPQLLGGSIIISGEFKEDNIWTSNGASFEFNENSGKLISYKDNRKLGTFEQIEKILFNLHYASYAGTGLKIIYTIFGLISGLMPITGFILWKKRKLKKSKI